MFGVCVMNVHSLPLPDVQRIVMEMVEHLTAYFSVPKTLWLIWRSIRILDSFAFLQFTESTQEREEKKTIVRGAHKQFCFEVPANLFIYVDKKVPPIVKLPIDVQKMNAKQ